MTNHEKIKAMDIAQMAEFIDDLVSDCDNCPAFANCVDGLGYSHRCCAAIRDWLKEESQ